MLNFAVVGLGAVGKIHATNLLDNDAAKLSAVCDPRADATLPFTEASDATATECVDQLLETQPDAVIISSSTATHEEIVGKCVAANVPFLCEKPLAQNIESAEAAGDRYSTRSSLAANGAGTLIAACLGSCFPTTIYIGHPGWKRMGARAGYSLLNAAFFLLVILSGSLARRPTNWAGHR